MYPIKMLRNEHNNKIAEAADDLTSNIEIDVITGTLTILTPYRNVTNGTVDDVIKINVTIAVCTALSFIFTFLSIIFCGFFKYDTSLFFPFVSLDFVNTLLMQ